MPAQAAHTDLADAIRVAQTAQPGWVLAAELTASPSAYHVVIVADDGAVHRVQVNVAEGSVLLAEPWGGEEARDAAAEVLDRSLGIAPDLVALIERIDGISEGCSWSEVELEIEDGKLVMEIECRVGDVELELGFDAIDERLVEVELELEGEDEDDEEGEEEDRASLGLTVVVTTDGFEVRGDGVALRDDDGSLLRSPEGGDYPYGALSALLARIKAEHPDEESVTVAAVGIIPYEVLIATLDACREQQGAGGPQPLFRSVVISAGDVAE